MPPLPHLLVGVCLAHLYQLAMASFVHLSVDVSYRAERYTGGRRIACRNSLVVREGILAALQLAMYTCGLVNVEHANTERRAWEPALQGGACRAIALAKLQFW